MSNPYADPNPYVGPQQTSPLEPWQSFPDDQIGTTYATYSPGYDHPHELEDVYNIDSDEKPGVAQTSIQSTTNPRPASLDSLQEIPWDVDQYDRPKGYQITNTVRSVQADQTFWDPIWLRKSVLIACALLFGTLAVVILAIYIVSARDHGLGPYVGTFDLIYLWKYLPTTAIVLLIAVWNGIDFTARLLQPWSNLKAGSSSAEHTILLDLISPVWPSVLLCAGKIRAWLPVLTVIGVVLLDVMRIVSTGLLQLESVSKLDKNFPLVKTAVFDASSWEPEVLDVTTPMLYNGILSENLTRPLWVLNNATFEPFEPLPPFDISRTATYTSLTKGIFPSLDCEIANIEGSPEITDEYSSSALMLFASSSCTVQVELPLVDPTQTFERMGQWAKRNFMGHAEPVTCPDQTQRYLALVTLVDADIKLLQSSAIICRPTYFVHDITIKIEYPQQRLVANWNGLQPDKTRLDSLDAFSLLGNIVNSTGSANFPVVYQPPATTTNNIPFLRSAALPLTNADSSICYLEYFLDPEVFIQHTQLAFSVMAALAVNNNMLSPRADPVDGTSVYLQDRIQVRLGAAAPMITLLLLCLAMTIAILFMRPQDTVPRDPNSIGGVALLLNASNDMKTMFEPCIEELSEQLMEPSVPDTRLAAVNEDGVSYISTTLQEESISIRGPMWWRPMALTVWARGLAIIVPACIIGALEAVQQVSDRSQGTATIIDPATAHFAATLVPAVVMWGVATVYSSINFNTVLLSPYHALSKGNSPASRSLLSHNLGRLPVVSLVSSINQRHWAAVFTALGAILGPFLTIVVSGLYSIKSNGSVSTVVLNRVDTFNVSWSGDPFDDGGAGQVLSLVLWQNLSYPAWTYEDLAIPGISVANLDTILQVGSPSLTVTIPARRAVLECDATGPEDVTVRVTQVGSDVYTSVKSTCPGSSGEAIQIRILPNSMTNLTNFAGQLTQLSQNEDSANAFGPYPSHPPPMNSNGCQSLVFYFGSFPPTIPERNEEFNLSFPETQITTLACKQVIQEVDVAVQFHLPGLVIDASRPPVANESTIRVVGDGTSEASTVQEFLIMYPLNAQFQPVTSDESVFGEEYFGLDAFYKAILFTTGVKSSELVGQENIPRLTSATNKMYGRYMAQAMSRKMRSPAPGASQTLSGVLKLNETRIVQNKGPKVALQVLLGLMIGCCIAAWLTMRTSRLLLHDPRSIAGMWILLAGSELCGSNGRRAAIPEGVEWMSDRELKDNGLWNGVTFGMGWWKSGRFGIDVGAPERRPQDGAPVEL